MDSPVEVKSVELRDLESLLSQTYGKRLIIVHYTTENLLPPGENYGSTILSVRAIIKKDELAEEEDLRLIAKMSPLTKLQQWIFDSPFTFPKEIFMYTNILPAYNQLEREAGLRENEIFSILPKFYASRLSLKSNGKFDEDAVILLENLKVKGYYTGKRSTGYDLEHSMIAIRAMARFHALGIVMKYKKPDMFENFKARSKCMDLNGQNSADVYTMIAKKIEEDPIMNPYHKKCSPLLTYSNYVAAWTSIPNEPWSTITHSDFWVNNIMFHRGKDGNIDDIKFIDFQNYLFFSPLRELIFYLFSSVEEYVIAKHLNELIDFYHQCLLVVLRRMGCDTTPFAKEQFKAQIPQDAHSEFAHLCIMLRVLTLDTKDANLNYDQIESVMTDYQGSQLFIERLRRVVLYFSEQNWI